MKSSKYLWLLILSFTLAGCTESFFAQDPIDGQETTTSTLAHVDIDTVLAQGLRDLGNGDAEKAQESFSKVLTVKPESTQASLGLAESQLALGQANESLQLFAALETQPELRAVALQGQGLSHYRLGRRDLAKQFLGDAINVDGTLWRSWNALGQLHDADEDWEAANTAYQTGIAENPNSASLHNNKGMSLLMQEKVEAALAEFDQAVALNSGLKTAASNRQIALAMLGRYSEALKGVPQGERYIVLNNIGYIAMTKGDLKRARHYFNLAAEESPSYYEQAEENLRNVEQLMSNDGTEKY
jgi:Tfp pilus assembly protein PilF